MSCVQREIWANNVYNDHKINPDPECRIILYTDEEAKQEIKDCNLKVNTFHHLTSLRSKFFTLNKNTRGALYTCKNITGKNCPAKSKRLILSLAARLTFREAVRAERLYDEKTDEYETQVTPDFKLSDVELDRNFQLITNFYSNMYSFL